MFLYREPVKFVAELISSMKPHPILMFDMAHVWGFMAHFKPLSARSRRCLGSTHKTFFGPQQVITGV
jgi:glycine/serine hydroxymethyltransferase